MGHKAMIAMSGGVDSAVAAYLMLQEGTDCVGGTLRLYTGAEECKCSSRKAVEDAENVARRLGIPFYVLEAEQAFKTNVMDAFVEAYEQGLTPNPCVACNRHLKFRYLLERAEEMGCDTVVTGHYARIRQDGGRYLLYRGEDSAKDQTYFLYTLSQYQLAHTRFPLGELTKEQTRQIAREQDFLVAGKRDSQDICFVPDGDYLAFMERYTGKRYRPGDFLDAEGKVVGKHRGAAGYTLGQRKGLGLAMGCPVYVCGKDMGRNTVTVGPEALLMRRTLIATDCNWFPFDTLTEPMRIRAKTRSRQIEQPAVVYPEGDGKIRVVFEEPQRASTPGQAVVMYDGDLVVGGGTITEVL